MSELTHIRELPTVPACRLDGAELAAQLERYRQIAGHVESIERAPGRIVARLHHDLDTDHVERTLEVERRCCSFIDIDYDSASERLTLSVASPADESALDAVFEALSPDPLTGAPAVRRV